MKASGPCIPKELTRISHRSPPVRYQLQEAGSFPSVFKEGWLRLKKKVPFLSGADGVVSKRSRSLLLNIRVAHLILLEFTNHPVCAAKERDLFINGAATPAM